MGCFVSNKTEVIGTNISTTTLQHKSNRKTEELISQVHFINGSENKVTSFYKVLSKIGAGTYGCVYKVLCLKTKIIRAMKVIEKESLSQLEEEAGFIKEIDILRQIDHPSIMKIFEYFVDSKSYYVIMEYVNGGELYDTIIGWTEFSEKKAANIFSQIVSAVCNLHDKNIVHRDLKPENIMVEKVKNSDECRIKLIDFGSCYVLTPGSYLNLRVGTPYYIAPEVLNMKYTLKCDVWSCGVILYILLSGSPPFPGKHSEEIFANIRKGDFSFNYKEWINVSKEAKTFISQMLTSDPEKRLSIQECVKNPWLQKFKDKGKVDVTVMQTVLKNLKRLRAKEKIQKSAIAYIVHFFAKSAETTELRNTFLALDVNQDGKLTYEELKKGFAKVFGDNLSEIEFNNLVDEIDQDNNGFIEYHEFLRAAVNQQKMLDENNLKRAFQKLDENKDGCLSSNELKVLLGNTENVILDQILKKIDLNSDGQVSYVEFVELMRNFLETKYVKAKTMMDSKLSKLESNDEEIVGFTVNPKKNVGNIKLNQNLVSANISKIEENDEDL